MKINKYDKWYDESHEFSELTFVSLYAMKKVV